MNRKDLISVCFAAGFSVAAFCGASAETTTLKGATEQAYAAVSVGDGYSDIVRIITEVYDNLVFAIDAPEEINPVSYFTPNALKKLEDEYEFDCFEGDCYAFYALRTGMQDSNPEADDVSRIYAVVPQGDGWYLVSYCDMGWPGKTRIKIADGKIDDYERMQP